MNLDKINNLLLSAEALNADLSSPMPAIIFDTETTGFNDPRIIEAGYIEVDIANGQLLHGMPYLARYNPEKPSELGALKTHHILDSELIGCHSYKEFSLPNGIEYIICQNSDYDIQMVPNADKYKAICTVGMARKLWPEADSHSLTAMMYHIFGRTDEVRQLIKQAHSAIADCMMTWHLLNQIIIKSSITDLEQLYHYSNDCKITTARLRFGKHKGRYLVDLVDIEPSYLVWLKNQIDMDKEVRNVASKLVEAYGIKNG